MFLSKFIFMCGSIKHICFVVPHILQKVFIWNQKYVTFHCFSIVKEKLLRVETVSRCQCTPCPPLCIKLYSCKTQPPFVSHFAHTVFYVHTMQNQCCLALMAVLLCRLPGARWAGSFCRRTAGSKEPRHRRGADQEQHSGGSDTEILHHK